MGNYVKSLKVRVTQEQADFISNLEYYGADFIRAAIDDKMEPQTREQFDAKIKRLETERDALPCEIPNMGDLCKFWNDVDDVHAGYYHHHDTHHNDSLGNSWNYARKI